MKYYTRKPELVEAVRFDGSNFSEVIDFCGDKLTMAYFMNNSVWQYARVDKLADFNHDFVNGFFMKASFTPTGNFLREEEQYVSEGDYIVKCVDIGDRTIYMIMPENVFNTYYEDSDSCSLDGVSHT